MTFLKKKVILSIVLVVIISLFFLLNFFSKDPGYSLKKIRVISKDNLLNIIDENVNLSFWLPKDWIERQSNNVERWKIIFGSKDNSYAIRYGIKKKGKNDFTYDIIRYIQKRTKKYEGVLKKLKHLSNKEIIQINADKGIVADYLIAGSVWKREHLIALQKKNKIFIFSLLSKRPLVISSEIRNKNEFVSNFNSLKNPIFVLSNGIRFY